MPALVYVAVYLLRLILLFLVLCRLVASIPASYNKHQLSKSLFLIYMYTHIHIYKKMFSKELAL
ncbi:hypothetical protein Hanom_Chr16g01416721 [Helianthus anomalus]